MNMDLIFEILIGFFFVFIGIFFLFYTWKDYKLAKKTRNWPQITGTIIKSEVISTLSRSGRRAHQVHYPDIHYKYNVDKQEYVSSQIFIGSIGQERTKKSSHKYVSKYPVGKQVMVRYSPYIYQLSDKEKHSVLEAGINRAVYASGLLNIVFAVGGGIFLFNMNVEYGIWIAVAGVALGGWAGSKIPSSSLSKFRPGYISNNPKIPGTGGIAGTNSNLTQRLADLFVKAGNSYVSHKRRKNRFK